MYNFLFFTFLLFYLLRILVVYGIMIKSFNLDCLIDFFDTLELSDSLLLILDDNYFSLKFDVL
jgi:hypothetical protein